MNDLGLKERVCQHISPSSSVDELSDHNKYTDNTIGSQREFLKRIVVERADNPLEEVDVIKVIDTLDEDTICPFITNQL